MPSDIPRSAVDYTTADHGWFVSRRAATSGQADGSARVGPPGLQLGRRWPNRFDVADGGKAESP